MWFLMRYVNPEPSSRNVYLSLPALVSVPPGYHKISGWIKRVPRPQHLGAGAAVPRIAGKMIWGKSESPPLLALVNDLKEPLYYLPQPSICTRRRFQALNSTAYEPVRVT